MKKLLYVMIFLSCSLYPQFTEARWVGDKWVQDTPADKAAQKKELAKKRADYAASFEKGMLSKGMDVHVSASGPENKHFKIKYVLMNRPLVHKLTNESDLLKNLFSMGFSKATLTDGHNNTWLFDINDIFKSQKEKIK